MIGLDLINTMKINLDYWNDGISYMLNSDGARCDEFTEKNNKVKVLFIGCSHTFGIGQELEDVWCHKLYTQISKELDIDGFYNLGLPGATINDIIFNFFRYIKKYGVPDIVFALWPERDRDDEYFYSEYDTVYSDYFSISIYQMFDTFCSLNNIQVIASTSIMDYENILNDFQYVDPQKNKPPRDLLNLPPVRNDFNSFKEYEKMFKTFKMFDTKKFLYDMHDFSIKNKDHQNLYYAKDRNNPNITPHFGAAFHEAWKTQFYERFINEKNNIQN